MVSNNNFDRRMVPYEINLNQLKPEDPNSKALVVVHDARPLATIPPRQHGYGRSYYAQLILIAPPQPLLLKGPREGPVVDVPTKTRILPPRPNERIIGVKTNRRGELSSVKYTTEEEHPYFEGIRASKVRFIPPKDTLKGSLSSFESPPKRHKTVADLDKDFHSRDDTIIQLQSDISFLNRQVSHLNTITESLRRDIAMLKDQVKTLQRH